MACSYELQKEKRKKWIPLSFNLTTSWRTNDGQCPSNDTQFYANSKAGLFKRTSTNFLPFIRKNTNPTWFTSARNSPPAKKGITLFNLQRSVAFTVILDSSLFNFFYIFYQFVQWFAVVSDLCNLRFKVINHDVN